MNNKIIVEFTYESHNGIPPKEIRAKFPDYSNCCNSPNGFGQTPEDALVDLIKNSEGYAEARDKVDFIQYLKSAKT